MNRNDSDAGQLALKAAASATRGTLYPFKVLEVDGGYVTWQGEVFGYGPSYGSVNTVRSVKTSVSIRPSTVKALDRAHVSFHNAKDEPAPSDRSLMASLKDIADPAQIKTKGGGK
jgi:hypothetical protein